MKRGRDTSCLSALDYQADFFFFSSTSSNSASTTFSSGLAPPGRCRPPAAAGLRRRVGGLLGLLRLVHRLAELHRRLAETLGGLLQRGSASVPSMAERAAAIAASASPFSCAGSLSPCSFRFLST